MFSVFYFLFSCFGGTWSHTRSVLAKAAKVYLLCCMQSFSFTYSSSSLGKSLLVCCNHHLTTQIASPAANQNENLLACFWSYSPKAVSYICHKIGIPPIRQHAPFSPAHDSGLEPSRPSLSLSNPIKSLNQVYKPRFPAIYG